MNEFVAVKPILVVGGAVGEVVLAQPDTGNSERRISGAAFNVARTLRQLNVPVINGIPVGNGEWGAAIEAAMQQLGLPVLLRHGLMDNGWCQTLVEPNGERTVASVVGCESQWNKAQLATLPLEPETVVYVHGDQMAGESGDALCEWLTRMPFDQWRLLTPGPLVGLLSEEFFAMISDSHTLLTLNRSEVASLCGEGDPVIAAQHYATAHNITLICRLDRYVTWICDGHNAPQSVQGDAPETSDAHNAGLLAGLSAGWSLPQAVDLANRVAACVLSGKSLSSIHPAL
ncbi:PfkB family carbohydrate kinase [Serratia silvae]|uniref:Ribokinase n=1 Tax=Serratia silvae TaxID=2824122 RepID=A0ABT0KBK0_9GAMM|nr:PfkB family carbohydrate kinase [Serratia silvae]MCL1029391.1 ribokinase [Serratia silvae]